VPTLKRNHVHNLPVGMPPKPIVEAFDAQDILLMNQQQANEVQSRTLAAIRETLFMENAPHGTLNDDRDTPTN